MGDFIINGKTVASLQIGGKEVIRIADGQTILWEKTSPQPVSDYLCFTANAANCSVGMTHNGTNQTTTQPVMYYSTDQTNWTLWDYSTITLANAGDKVYFYGDNPNGFSTSSSNYSKFTTSGSVACSGNIMTLITRDGSETTLPSDYCFVNLFKGTSITTAPELPATTLTSNCYNSMFYNCTSLKTAPELPATNLATNCYYSMFYNCTSLVNAPELPATTLASYCYSGMFNSCTSLATAPELPATTLARDCYNGMFYDCTSLTTPPSELPATTLASYCYSGMFKSCTSLTTAPALPATNLAKYCYSGMFNGCSQLNYIKVGATTWGSSNTNNWVNGVAATGTFVKPADLVIGTGTGQIPSNSTSGIPSGWTVQNTNDYLCFTAEEANSTIGMEHFNTNQTTTQPVLYHSTDKTNWTLWDFSTITLQNVGDKVYFYGDNPNGVSSSEGYSIFRTTKNVACSGDIMTLLNVNGGYVIPNNNCFSMLFAHSKITTPPELPATTLTEFCYHNMFQWCFYLTTAPVLPATTVPPHAYSSMFYQCTSLTVAPELPATTLSTQCYSRMFEKCSNLTTAPSVLPATTLANACYENMFYDCTSLTTAPLLPATTLAQSCYVFMFDGCTSLNNITCLATNITANHCTLEWLENVASTGTFTKNPQMSSWTTGTSGIPSGWTVQDYQ